MDGHPPDDWARFGDVDALLWAADRDPLLAGVVSSIAIFDAVIPPKAVETRLGRATRAIPRMRQRVVSHPRSVSPPRWEFDAEFDLTNHLQVVQCPGGGIHELLDLAARFVAEPLDPERPMFRYLLVQRVDADRSALVMKAHHAMADGLGTLAIQAELFDSEPDTPDPTELPIIPGPHVTAAGDRFGEALESQLRRGLGALQDLARTLTDGATGPTDVFDRAVDTLGSALRALEPVTPLSPILIERSDRASFDVITVSLPELKAAGKKAGTKMNAVFVAAVARGLGMFHEELGSPVKLLRMGMPVNQRPADAAGQVGNSIAPVRLELPVTAEEPEHLMQIVEALIDAQRAEAASSLVEPAAKLVSQLPAPLAGKALAHVLKGSDFLTSNVAGSQTAVYLGPARMLAQFPFGPTSAAALNVTLLSYLDEAHIGVAIDAAVTDKPGQLAECLRRGFAWILGEV